MPYCPLNVSELPLKTLEPSPHVVDAKKYMESRPDVYLARKTMAPLDGVVTFLWLKDPRYLQQFLNRRCSLFVCQIKRTNPDNGEISWKMTIMRQKMSESLHTIELSISMFVKNEYEELSIKTSKIHYITDGHILRFECHDVDASEIWATPNSPTTKATSKATLENLSQPDKIMLFFAMVVMEFECQDLLNPDVVPVDEIPEFRFVFDGKWKKPDDLIICPRLRSRGFYPLMVYYQFDGERKCENEDETLLQGLAFLGVIIGTKYGECFVVIARLLWIAEKEDAEDAVGPVFNILSNQIQRRKNPVLKHTLLNREKKTIDRYEPVRTKGLQDVEAYKAFTDRRYAKYRSTGETARRDQFERSRKHRSAPKPPVPLFGQSRSLEQKINKETFAYRLSMDSPAGARISQETFTTGSMYSLFPSTCTDIELVAPPPSFNQPELSHFNPRENTWGKAESDLLISQIGSWGTNGEPWKLLDEEQHNSVHGANRREDYEQWQRNRAGHEKCKMGLFFKGMGRD
ncbi:hypothetical protein ACHAP3_007751 [Botrytis cinerea]